MNLLTWGEEPETRGDKYPCSAFRWALVADEWNRGVALAIAQQYRWRSTGSWRWETSHARFYGLSLTSSFEVGIDHTYYDGPHCSLSLGFLHILWSGNPLTGWCKKCAPSVG